MTNMIQSVAGSAHARKPWGSYLTSFAIAAVAAVRGTGLRDAVEPQGPPRGRPC